MARRHEPGNRQSAEQADLAPELADDLIRAAVAAPSMHNTQPWRFRVAEASQTIELYADAERQLGYGDPQGRAVHIACGAALLNLRLAAAIHGRQAVVQLLSDPGQPLLLATVRLGGACRVGDVEAELHAAIPRRHTNREPFSGRRVPPGVLAELTEAAAIEGAILHILDRDEAARVLQLAAEAERTQLADPRYRAELAHWAGGERDREGIPGASLGPRSPESLTPVRDFAPGHEPGGFRYAWFEEHPQLAVLSTHSGHRTDWLRAGQALQRVLLTATARGISVSPLTQPLETGEAWLVRNHRSGTEQPQMILRFGYGLPVHPSPRRPVSEVLAEPQPGAGPQSGAGPQPGADPQPDAGARS
jgi:nitroreductase